MKNRPFLNYFMLDKRFTGGRLEFINNNLPPVFFTFTRLLEFHLLFPLGNNFILIKLVFIIPKVRITTGLHVD